MTPAAGAPSPELTEAMIEAAYRVLQGALNHQGDYARVEQALRVALAARPSVPRGFPTVAQLAAWLTEGIEKFRYVTTGAYTDRQALAEWLRARLAGPGADPALQLTTEDRLRGQVFALQDLLRETQRLLAEWQHNAAVYEGCPCTIVTPCNKNCSCANRYLSGGCLRCCKYGSEEQRRAAAERLAALGTDL